MSYLHASSTIGVVVIALLGCRQEPVSALVAPSKPEVSVRLGHVAPQTGPQAVLGNDNAARMAVDELNSKTLEIGGARIKFELVCEDDHGDPDQGAIVAQKLVDARVNGIVGSLSSGTTSEVGRIYSEAGIPQIYGSASRSKYSERGFATTFRVITSDLQQGQALGEYAARQMAARTVAIIDDRSAYGRGLADGFEKSLVAAGSKVVVRESTDAKATDFTAILSRIKRKKTDVILFAGMDAQGGLMLRQIKSLGLKAQFLTGDGGCTPQFIKLAGVASQGQYCALPGVPLDQMPGGEAFAEAFASKYGEISRDAPYLYDALMVMVDAMKRAGSVDSARFLPMIGKANYNGVTGKVQFDDKGDLKYGAISLYQARDGKWQFLEVVGAPPPHKGTDEDDDE